MGLYFALLLQGTLAQAASFQLNIHERLLNKVAARVNVPIFQGNYRIDTGSFLPDINIGWSSTVKNVDFDVTSSGIEFSADLVTSYSAVGQTLSHTKSINGNAFISLGTNEIVFGMTNIGIPITIPVPGYGNVTVFTITSTLPYRMDYPFVSIFPLKSGEGSNLRVKVYDLVRHYRSNRVRITGKTRMWQ